MRVSKKKIIDIVDENYIHASVLHYFGIEFYNYSEKTLEQVCQEKGLIVDKVIEELEAACSEENGAEGHKLNTCPVDLIIEYLKHAHYVFIKRKLPYIAKLIRDFQAQAETLTQIDEDLKFIFPIFVEDFIHHIYEEEDTFFSYILALQKAHKNKEYNPTGLYYMMEKNSIQQFAMEHDCHDDEMNGIRQITNDYKIEPGMPLHVRVIYAELQAFEATLITHANVENQILFPKALALEKQVKKMIEDKVSLN